MENANLIKITNFKKKLIKTAELKNVNRICQLSMYTQQTFKVS
jgi:hypothetical protein